MRRHFGEEEESGNLEGRRYNDDKRKELAKTNPSANALWKATIEATKERAARHALHHKRAFVEGSDDSEAEVKEGPTTRKQKRVSHSSRVQEFPVEAEEEASDD